MPAVTVLANTPSPPPTMPESSELPAIESNSGAGDSHFFLVGTCLVGAILTVTPTDAAVTELVWYAADGGAAAITVAGRPGQSYLLQAWSDDGSYLGQYEEEGFTPVHLLGVVPDVHHL